MIKISSHSCFVAATAAMFLLSACGADSSGAAGSGTTSSGTASSAAASSGADQPGGGIHACELAPASDVARIFGKTVADASPSMESARGKAAFSQCSYRFEGGGMGLSVQVRRSESKVGVSRQADADTARARNDSLGVGEDMAAAIEAGTDIAGLGDLAYEFDDQGNYQQLVVYWNDHYQLAIVSYGGGAAADAAAARRELARLVIDRL